MSEDFDSWTSRTYSFQVGCGKIFITVVSYAGQIIKVITHRKSIFACDLTFFDALNRQTSFQTNRELEQAIDDLMGNEHPREGHFCHKYGIKVKSAVKQGKLGAFSCVDAVSQAIRKEISELSE